MEWINGGVSDDRVKCVQRERKTIVLLGQVGRQFMPLDGVRVTARSSRWVNIMHETSKKNHSTCMSWVKALASDILVEMHRWRKYEIWAESFCGNEFNISKTETSPINSTWRRRFVFTKYFSLSAFAEQNVRSFFCLFHVFQAFTLFHWFHYFCFAITVGPTVREFGEKKKRRNFPRS